MQASLRLIAGGLAALLLAGSAAVALADSPSMASSSSIYDKPRGEVIDSIDRGDDVQVGKCRHGYCYVKDLDDDDTDPGWVRSSAIDFSSNNDDGIDDASPVNDNGSLIDLDGLPPPSMSSPPGSHPKPIIKPLGGFPTLHTKPQK